MYQFFYLPYLYTQKAKLGKNGRLLSYFLMLVFPPAYFGLVLQSEITFLNVLFVILGSIYVQNLYEIGYIQNDTETIKKEISPTLRLNKLSLNYYELNKWNIYGFRIIIATIICFILLFLSDFNNSILVFLLVASLIIPIYLVYNNIRNNWNLFLHFLLAILKYTSVQFLFFDTFKMDIFILSLFAYPVMNLIDRAATPRFLNKLSLIYIPKTPIYRLLYYSILLITCCILCILNIINIFALLIVVYYFLYRLSIVIFGIK